MPRSNTSIPFLLGLLSLGLRKRASAIYVVPWSPPALRLNDRIVPASSVIFEPEHTAALVRSVMNERQRAQFDQSRDMHLSLLFDGVGRFRVNVFRRHGQPAMVLHPVSTDIPTLHALGLPPAVGDIALARRGLVLVAGNSDALRAEVVAAIVGHRNRWGSGDIVLADGAPRYWHNSQSCTIWTGDGTRSVDELVAEQHQKSGSQPLAVALCDVDDDLAPSGALHHALSSLCISSVRAEGVAELFEQVSSLMPLEARDDSLASLSLVLHAAIGVRRVPALDGRRHVAAAEILLNGPEVTLALGARDGDALHALMRAGREQGMQTVDQHLADHVEHGVLSRADAERHAVDPAGLQAEFERRARRALARFAEGADDAPMRAPQPEPEPELEPDLEPEITLELLDTPRHVDGRG